MALDCILLQLHFSYILTNIEVEIKAAFLLHFDCIYMQFCCNKTLFIMQFSCILTAFQAQYSAQKFIPIRNARFPWSDFTAT